MLCQICKKRYANVQVTQVVNGEKAVAFICDNCAREKGQPSYGYNYDLGSFIAGFMGNNIENNSLGMDNATKSQIACNKCGMFYSNVLKTGKFGCENCYTAFRNRVLPIIKRVHGSTTHKGKFPERMSEELLATKELESLKSELSKAIQLEEYEQAAEIRDKIRSIEGGETNDG